MVGVYENHENYWNGFKLSRKKSFRNLDDPVTTLLHAEIRRKTGA